MPRFMFGTDDPEEATRIMTVMQSGPQSHYASGPAHSAGIPAAPPPAMPPMPRPTALPQPNAMPAMPGPATPPPPPMSAPSANPRLENVVKLMDAYSKGGNPTNGVAGVKKVLAVLGIQRAQDANEAQLEWLEQAFANPAWTPS